MFNLYLRFITLSNLLMFLLISAAGSLWIYRCLKKNGRLSLAPFILINLALFIIWGRLKGINGDEPEHLHCAWMVSQGLIPFKDFWQHHSPFFWVVLAPILGTLRPSVLVFEISRILAGLIFMLSASVGWQIAKEVWGKERKLPVYLLILFSGAVSGQFLWLRPDLFMVFFLLAGVYFSLQSPGLKLLPSFFAGICLAIAASFTQKQYLLFFLVPIGIFIVKDKSWFKKVLAYLGGAALGVLPLVYYLIKNNILGEYIFWVFKFNSQSIIITMVFPLGIGSMGAWGGYLLLNRYYKLKDTKALILFMAICLSTLSSMTSMVSFSASYYLQFWLILCAVAGSGCDIMRIMAKISSLTKKSALAGVFCSLLIMPNFISTLSKQATSFSQDKKTISRLMGYCCGDTCVVLLPMHPVFNYDATRVYAYWQYYYFDQFSSVKKDAKKKDIAVQITNLRPAVIVQRYEGRDFLLELFQKGIITKEGYNKVLSFLKDNYMLKAIGKGRYYIRNDKL